MLFIKMPKKKVPRKHFLKELFVKENGESFEMFKSILFSK
jgi:hypothetical protein